MNLILLGAPGAGKGTQALELSKILKIPHISTGEIFRDNIRKNTELGKTADLYISKGELVPDEITTAKEALYWTDFRVRSRRRNPWNEFWESSERK